jgi:hypothetical protein
LRERQGGPLAYEYMMYGVLCAAGAGELSMDFVDVDELRGTGSMQHAASCIISTNQKYEDLTASAVYALIFIT